MFMLKWLVNIKKEVVMGHWFLIGFILNFFKNCFLNLLMILMLFLGIWFRPCLYLGLILLAINVLLSFILQLRLKRAIKKFDASKSEDARKFNEYMRNDGYTKGARNYTEYKINNSQDIIIDDSDYTVKSEDEQK